MVVTCTYLHCFTNMTDRFVFFYSIKDEYFEFSQWYRCDFEVNGIRFNCAEQYYMWRKANLFNDRQSVKSIMLATNPREQKALGRAVQGYVDAEWKSILDEVLYSGNMAKFTCNAHLGKLILSTGDRLLVEASPFDRLCGIGFNSATALSNLDQWGCNYLGKALMRVREKLRSQSSLTSNTVKVWTDGSCINNGTEGAKCGLGVYYGPSDKRNRSVSLLHGRITNNRAELSAVLYALCSHAVYVDIEIFTDSQYSINCLTKYKDKWRSNGWKTTTGKPVESVDMIKYTCDLIDARAQYGSDTTFIHVKGHSTDANNNAVDKLARLATSSEVDDAVARFMVLKCKVPL